MSLYTYLILDSNELPTFLIPSFRKAYFPTSAAHSVDIESMFLNMSRVLLLFTLCSSLVWSLAINQLSDSEKKVLSWIKTYTVPNTLDSSGNPWTTNSLPQSVRSWSSYDSKIKPSSYAAAVVTAWSLSEGIFRAGYFYGSSTKGLLDSRCSCFEFPSPLPAIPAGGFPIEVFTYNLCQGKSVSPNPKTNTYQHQCDCSCTAKCPGQMIGPNQKCIGRSAKESDWQNGIWGMEQSHVGSAEAVAGVAEKIYGKLRGNGYTYVDVLDNTITQAGFARGSGVYEKVMGCFPVKAGKRVSVPAKDLTWVCADLVTMWLVRNHLVGLTVAMGDNLGWLPGHLNDVLVLARYFNS